MAARALCSLSHESPGAKTERGTSLPREGGPAPPSIPVMSFAVLEVGRECQTSLFVFILSVLILWVSLPPNHFE